MCQENGLLVMTTNSYSRTLRLTQFRLSCVVRPFEHTPLFRRRSPVRHDFWAILADQSAVWAWMAQALSRFIQRFPNDSRTKIGDSLRFENRADYGWFWRYFSVCRNRWTRTRPGIFGGREWS